MQARKVLVVDDSAFMRKMISEHINNIPGFEVVATAHDGEACLYKIERFKPDVVTLDIEMPGMNGLETLEKIKEKWTIPVFMLSSTKGKDTTIAALEAGAIDFIEKPVNLREKTNEFQRELTSHLEAVFNKQVQSDNRPISKPKVNRSTKISKRKAIVIGASTGGPQALLKIIEYLPEYLTIPVFIVQHMPKGFTASFANRLDKHSKRPVVEAKDGERIEPGKVYLAPGDYHMLIRGEKIQLTQGKKVNRVRPAVDLLFESAVKKYGSEILGILLTGMGKDGTYGFEKIKEAGGHTVAQDEASSMVFGMPASAAAAGVVDVCANLEQIGRILNEVAQVSK